MARKQKKKKKTKRKGRLLRKIFLLLVSLLAVLALAGAATAGGAVWYYGQDLPDLSDLREDYRPLQISRIETYDGVIIGEIFEERRTVVPFDEIPEILVNAALAAEDADFYQHEGLDYPGMIRALLINIREGRIAQGASTITQQVVQTFYIGRERTYARKIREALLARRLEQYLAKEEILFLYLNQINFGHARYGVQQASRFYFDRDVGEINLAQAALLAGMPRGPTIYSPRRHPDRALARRNWVLGQMEAKGLATAADVAAARASDLGLRRRDTNADLAPEAVGRVQRELTALVGDEEVRLGGYLVRTTIDSRMQKAARRALRNGLHSIDERHDYRVPLRRTRGRPDRAKNLQGGRTYLGRVTGRNNQAGTVSIKIGKTTGSIQVSREKRYNPKKLRPSKFANKGALARVSLHREASGDRRAEFKLELGPQAALVAVESGTGRIKALIGGYALRRGDFDRASHARRQPGSSFKPFVYSLALNSGRYTPATLIADAPEVFEQWRPSNYEEWSYEGHVRLRNGLAKSINMVAIKLIRDLGAEEVISYAKRLGIESPLEATPSLALGSSAVTPLEMAEAYSVFASDGVHREPRIIESIRRHDGTMMDIESPEPTQVIEPAKAYLISSMLRSVVRTGTATGARDLGDDIGGKTGTSNNAQDAWFVGFAPSMTCAVWVGFDDPRPLGRRESGSRAALPIWVEFMGSALGKRSRGPIDRPEGIVSARIDPDSGLLAYEGQENAIDEEFLEDTAPTEQAIPPDTADPDTFLMEQTGGK